MSLIKAIRAIFLNRKTKFIFILISIFSFMEIAIQSFIIISYKDALPTFITILNILSLLIYLCISIFSLYKCGKLEITCKSLEESNLYNKTLKDMNDNVRIFKHDFSNIMQSFSGYIINEDMRGLKEYYKGINTECNNVNTLSILSPSLINDPALYCLITSKYHLAETFGIKFNINLLINFKDINATPYILTRILGILLDNAIEAAKDSGEKEITFEVCACSSNAKVRKHVISVENSYINKDVNIEKIREKGYTSKSSDEGIHGLGLWEVNKILKKSKNLNLHTTKNDKFFIQQLEIFNTAY